MSVEDEATNNERARSTTINSLYECVQDLYSPEKETSKQVFKNPISLKVFSIEVFVEDGLNSFIKLSIAEGAGSLFGSQSIIGSTLINM
ncbi:hypothetical protein [Listeria aquatica]|uniref:hypothetical protein n=1 Tax=Listeria aquatica TaxID=1494960 RepID=UPI0031F5BBF8